MAAGRSLAARVKDAWGALFGGDEGAWRGPFFGVSPSGFSFGLGALEDGWQRDLGVARWGARYIPAAYAAVMANARAVSQCYATHKHRNREGEIEAVSTSAAFRTMMNPNPVETWPQFILNLIAAMQFEGNA